MKPVRRVFIVPGWKATPRSSWFASLGQRLSEHGCEVQILKMPARYTPIFRLWTATIREAVGKPDGHTYLIGHSAGATSILRYLEELKEGEAIGGAVLASGFPQALLHPNLPHVLTRQPKVGAIRGKAGWIFAIHSDDDWRVPISNGEWLETHLSAELVVLKGAGHISAKSGFRELPEHVVARILTLIEGDEHRRKPRRQTGDG